MSDQPDRFGERLHRAMAEHGSVCVGLDPHPHLLREWGLPDSVPGLRRFSLAVLDAAAGRCAALKPQSAFFERHGSAGVAVLEEVLAGCRERGLLSVLDVKRGDVGSTMQGYAQAYLAPGAPLAADSITLSPYLGYASLRPALDLAQQNGRGVWVLARTSNPEGARIQDAGSPTVAQQVLEQVAQDNAGRGPCGDIGVVIGATVDLAGAGLDLATSPTPVLAPGVGAQGATPQDVARRFRGLTDRVLVPISRAVLSAGPDGLESAIVDWGRQLTQAGVSRCGLAER